MIKTFEQFIFEECNEGLLDKLKLKRVKITSDYKKYIEELEDFRYFWSEKKGKIKFYELSNFEKHYLKDIKLALNNEEVAKKRELNKKIVKEYYREIIDAVRDMTISMHNGTYNDYDLDRSNTNAYDVRDIKHASELYELSTEIKLGDKPYKIISVFIVGDFSTGEPDIRKDIQRSRLISFYVFGGDKNSSSYLKCFSNEELEMTEENKDLDIYHIKDLFRSEKFVFYK